MLIVCVHPSSMFQQQKKSSKTIDTKTPKAEDELDKWMNSMEDKLKTNDSLTKGCKICCLP